MSRAPEYAAINELRVWLESGSELPRAFMLGMSEALGDVTTWPSDSEDIETYDAGREIARAVLGMD